MAQLFSRGSMLALKLAALLILILVVAGVLVWRWRIGEPYSAHAVVRQPVPFSHKHHAGEDGIDCRYCHDSVETSAFAGIPATEVCMTCHSQLYTTDAPPLAIVRASLALSRRLHWNRVHDLPDFVYFDHRAHVSHGVPCGACHGDVANMPMTRRESSLKMQWCLDCHREARARPDLTDCSTCHR